MSTILGLTNEQIGRYAPSALAQKASKVVSGIYNFIPTTRVINDLRTSGWYPVRAFQSKTKDENREGFQKHKIVFRNTDTLNRGLKEVGDTIPEILLTNSHDARSSFTLWAGLFRLICSNGMVVADETYDKFNIIHKGYNIQQLQKTLSRYLKALPRTLDRVNRFKEIQLDSPQQVNFAEQAYDLVYSGRKSTFNPVELLRSHRPTDEGNDLWRVFNRVQENVIRGGVRARNKTTGRRSITRGITAIDADISVNKDLYSIANSFVAA